MSGQILGQCINCLRDNTQITTRKKSIIKPCIADLTFPLCEKCADGWDMKTPDIRILVGESEKKDNSFIGRHNNLIWKFNLFGIGFMLGFLTGKNH